MAKVVVTLEGKLVANIELDATPLTIGRRTENGLQLDDPAVSRRHAMIAVLRNTYVVDLGSANGTFVNGRQVKKAALRHGDVIEVGRHQLTYLARPETTRSTGRLRQQR